MLPNGVRPAIAGNGKCNRKKPPSGKGEKVV